MSSHFGVGSSGTKNLAHQTSFHRSLKRKAKETGGAPCEICGTAATRYQDRLLTCKCGAREHIYCMQSPLSKVPKVWVCGDCHPLKSIQPSCSIRATLTKQHYALQDKKVKYMSLEEVMRVSNRDRCGSTAQSRGLSTPPKMKYHSERPQKPSRKSKNFVSDSPIKVRSPLAKPKQRGEVVSKVHPRSNQASEARKGNLSKSVNGSQRLIGSHLMEEALICANGADLSYINKKNHMESVSHKSVLNRNSSVTNGSDLSGIKKKNPMENGSQKSVLNRNSSLTNGSDTLGQKPLETVTNEAPMDVDLPRVEPGDSVKKAKGDSHVEPQGCQQLTDLDIPESSLSRRLNSPSILSEEASWTGKFVFSDPAIAGDHYDGQFEAYTTRKVHNPSYQYAGFLMDEVVVDLIPLDQLPSDLFQLKSWDLLDAGLFILPDCENNRSARAYRHLLRLMKTRNSAIRVSIVELEGIELLIFTSKQLHVDAICKLSGTERRVFIWGAFYDARTNSAPSPSPLQRTDFDSPRTMDTERAIIAMDCGPQIHDLAEWSCPHPGWVKLNTTTIFVRTTGFAIGTVHMSTGDWVVGFILKLCKTEQLKAELWALFQGLLILWGRGFRKVQVEYDSDQAPRCLNGVLLKSDPNKDLIEGCRDLLLREWEITHNVVSKEQNFPAVWLASNFGGSQDATLKILDRPSDGHLRV